MKRLTKWDEHNKTWLEDHDNDTRKWKNGSRAIMEKLAEYENTGCEPEEIKAMVSALTGKMLAQITEFEGVPLDRLRELAQADRDGRAVVLPCKVGDTVYAYDDVFNQIAPFRVDMVELYGHKGMSFCANWRKSGELMADLDFDRDNIGKTVFLTSAEAEGGGGIEKVKKGALYDQDQ